METIRFGLIAKEDIRLNPRNSTFAQTLADGRVVVVSALDVAYLLADNYVKASLPTSGQVNGQVARVSDDVRGLWMYQGAQWFSLGGEVVNVKEFGAKGDGSTDDTAAIRAAMTALSGGGTCYFPPGTYGITGAIGTTGVRVIGHSPERTTIKALSGGGGAVMLSAALNRDGVTASTDGAGGSFAHLTIDGNRQSWVGVRAFGARATLDNLVVTGCTDGVQLNLAIICSVRNVRSRLNSARGFYTFAASGQNGTSSCFESCWAEDNGTHGWYITQLYYSTFVNCVGQESTEDDWRVEGSVNSAGAGYSLSFYSCGSEAATAKPFNFIAQRDLVVVSPRVISPASGQHYLTLDNSQGTIIAFSTVGTPGGGAFSIAMVNDSTGIDRPVKLIGCGASGTLTLNDEDKFALFETQVGSRTRTLTNRLELELTLANNITADQNDYEPSDASIWRVSSDATRTITGIAGGTKGAMRWIYNAGSNNVVLAHQNAGSAAANRIITHTGADVTLAGDDSAHLFYDHNSSRWRILNVQT